MERKKEEVRTKILISVVIVTYNAEKEIKRSIESLYNQSTNCYEVIFIDGDSKDDTKNIIEFYRVLFRNKGIECKYISERDRGIYDAMNKGAILANGKWLYFLNSGDCLYDENVFRKIMGILQKDIDVVYGDILDDYIYKKEVLKAKRLKEIEKVMPFCHQASFTRTELVKKYLFNIEYSLCADYNLFLKLYIDKKIFKYVEQVIAVYSREGVSSNNTYTVLKQYRKSQIENGIYGFSQKFTYIKRILINVLRDIWHKIKGIYR